MNECVCVRVCVSPLGEMSARTEETREETGALCGTDQRRIPGGGRARDAGREGSLGVETGAEIEDGQRRA